MFVLSVLY